MVVHPFKTTGPLDIHQDREIYVERPELQTILREIARPYVESYLALLGSRQTGKTTLLFRIYQELQRIQEPVAFLDLSAYRAENAAQSYAHAALKIWEELAKWLTTPSKLRAVVSGVDGPTRFREFMLDMARHCRGTRIVILLDEVGSFVSNMGFFETIRNISSSGGHNTEQEFKKYLFVFSGAVDLHDLTISQNSPLANVCKPIYLQDFSSEGTAQLVDLLSDFAPLDSDIPAYVHDQTRGHPYLTQQICATIAELSPSKITEQIVDRAIERLQEGDENLRYVISQLQKYPQAGELLRKMVFEKDQDRAIPFSMLNPYIARLFVIGAVRRETEVEIIDQVPWERSRCVVRNPIYQHSFYNYFKITRPPDPEKSQPVPGTPPVRDQEAAHDIAFSPQWTGAAGPAPLPPAVDPRNYLDFSLHIYPSPTRGDPFPVTVESWAGSGNGKMLLDVRSLSLQALLQRLQEHRIEPDDLHTLGAMLWQALLASPEIERRYVACQAEASSQKGIRIKLNIESPDLLAIPWEYLYDPESQTFPGLSPRTPITRYTNPRQQDPPPLAFDPPLRILLVSAKPLDQPTLDVESELEQIIQAMERLQSSGKVEIEVLRHATVRKLQVMLRRPFHVLHYIGHGIYDEYNQTGLLALEDESGQQHTVSAPQLQYLLRDTTVRLAVFNACMTARGPTGRSIASELMKAGISATLAMQFAISEYSATIFAGEFYRTLADGWPVDAAVAEGRKAVMFATDLTAMDWGIPVLFMRTRDGILFRQEKAAARTMRTGTLNHKDQDKSGTEDAFDPDQTDSEQLTNELEAEK